MKKEHKDVPAYLTRNEYARLLESIRNTYQASSASSRSNTTLWLDEVVEFACHTGLRLSELCALRWGDINLDAQHLVVSNRHRTTKNGVERRVPLVGRALEIVKQKKRAGADGDHVVFHTGGHSRLNGEYVSKLFRRARRDAGLPDSISFHSLRHTCASWMVIAGADLYVVKEVLGHSSIEVTQKYAHLSPSSLAKGMKLAFGGEV